jgi:SAM-dependent methyltransferase
MAIAIKPVHPFPARMAPSIVWDKLPANSKPLKILDPMAGSGTTLAIARSRGHAAYGVDRDPLAILIANAWCSDIDKKKVTSKADEVLKKAKETVKTLRSKTAYPKNTDQKTKDFIAFWFDLKNRKQLTALSKHIALVRDDTLKCFLWTAFSRMIITKKIGVSLAMDISHSRPHKVYDKAPVTAFEQFPKEIIQIVKAKTFNDSEGTFPQATIVNGDARDISFEDNFFDMVITSPPYLNAIDYLRGHKLSLVWMKNSIEKIRILRSTNIGAEVKGELPDSTHIVKAVEMSGNVKKLTARQKGIFVQYVIDMDLVCSEIARVLKPGGKVTYVIGDSTIKGTFIKNSEAIKSLSKHHGLKLDSIEERILPENRRYLPPPSNKGSGKQLQARMRKEVILTMKKTA